MLQSPGHSPLHLSSPSPSVSQFPIQNTNDSGSVSQHQKIRNIERDYFPDISKLCDRSIEAIKTGDAVQIRDALLKIIKRRRGTKKNNPMLALEISRKYAAHCYVIASRFALLQFSHPALIPMKQEGGHERLRVGCSALP